MKSIKGKITKGLQFGSEVSACDNSGAKICRIISVVKSKTVKGRLSGCGVGDLIQVAVKKGSKDMQAKVTYATIVRQKKEYRRPSGIRVKFEDNAIVVLKDEKGNPKGTIFKGPIAKEVAERWPAVAKVASIIL